MYDPIRDIGFVQADVRDEAERAIVKHGIDRTPASLVISWEKRLVILAEELGEVAHECTYDAEPGARKRLYGELVQLAAMCELWATALR